MSDRHLPSDHGQRRCCNEQDTIATITEVLTLFLGLALRNKAQSFLRLPASSPLRLLSEWPSRMAPALEQIAGLVVEVEVR